MQTAWAAKVRRVAAAAALSDGPVVSSFCSGSSIGSIALSSKDSITASTAELRLLGATIGGLGTSFGGAALSPTEEGGRRIALDPSRDGVGGSGTFSPVDTSKT